MVLTATVVSINPFNIQFDGETTTSTRIYPRLGSYNPIMGDKVVVLNYNNLYLVLGKVV